MRGTIFYQGNRIEAVDNAKYYMQHKKKIRAIMSRQSPNLTTSPGRQGSAGFSLQSRTIDKNPYMTRSPRVADPTMATNPQSPDDMEAVAYDEGSLGTIINLQSQNPNNFHVAKVHRMTPSRHILTPSHLESSFLTQNAGPPSARAISTNYEPKSSQILYGSRLDQYAFEKPFQQSSFKLTSLNSVSKKRADVKISSENERLLKRIVEITFRNKPKKTAVSRHPAELDHVELATRPHVIRMHHSGETRMKQMKKIREENQGFFSKLSQIGIVREKSPGWVTNRKLETYFEQVSGFKRNISRLNRSPLSSGLQPYQPIYLPTLRSSYQHQRASLAPDLNESGVNVTRESHLLESKPDPNFPESTSLQVRRKLETSRARRIKPLMTPQEIKRFQDVRRQGGPSQDQLYSNWNNQNPSQQMDSGIEDHKESEMEVDGQAPFRN